MPENTEIEFAFFKLSFFQIRAEGPGNPHSQCRWLLIINIVPSHHCDHHYWQSMFLTVSDLLFVLSCSAYG